MTMKEMDESRITLGFYVMILALTEIGNQKKKVAYKKVEGEEMIFYFRC